MESGVVLSIIIGIIFVFILMFLICLRNYRRKQFELEQIRRRKEQQRKKEQEAKTQKLSQKEETKAQLSPKDTQKELQNFDTKCLESLLEELQEDREKKHIAKEINEIEKLKVILGSNNVNRIDSVRDFNFKIELIIDFHGLSVRNAQVMLKKILEWCPDKLLVLTIIHGYNHGTKIKQMVESFNNPRIQDKTIYSNNVGRTKILVEPQKKAM